MTKSLFFKETIGRFVDKYVLVEFDIEKMWREQEEQKRKQSTPQQRASTASLNDSTELRPGMLLKY